MYEGGTRPENDLKKDTIGNDPVETKRRTFFSPILGFLARFVGWWASLAGLMAVSGTFHGACGSRPECLGCLIIRVGSITLVSGAGALLMSKWRKLCTAVKRFLYRSKNTEVDSSI